MIFFPLVVTDWNFNIEEIQFCIVCFCLASNQSYFPFSHLKSVETLPDMETRKFSNAH